MPPGQVLIMVGAHFVRHRLLPSAMVGSHYGGDSFDIFCECALFEGTNPYAE